MKYNWKLFLFLSIIVLCVIFVVCWTICSDQSDSRKFVIKSKEGLLQYTEGFTSTSNTQQQDSTTSTNNSLFTTVSRFYENLGAKTGSDGAQEVKNPSPSTDSANSAGSNTLTTAPVELEGFVSTDYTKGIPYLDVKFESCAADVPQIFRTSAGFSTNPEPGFVEEPTSVQWPLTRADPGGFITHRTRCDASLANALDLHPDIYANFTSVRPHYTYIKDLTHTGEKLVGLNSEDRDIIKRQLIDGCRPSIPYKMQAEIDKLENIVKRGCNNNYNMYQVLSGVAPVTQNLIELSPSNFVNNLHPGTLRYKK
jgi:hypothetical protein